MKILFQILLILLALAIATPLGIVILLYFMFVGYKNIFTVLKKADEDERLKKENDENENRN